MEFIGNLENPEDVINSTNPKTYFLSFPSSGEAETRNTCGYLVTKSYPPGLPAFQPFSLLMPNQSVL
jgi:hypothetical protein